MIEKLAEQLVNLTIKQVNELASFLKKEYGIEPTNPLLVSSVASSDKEKYSEKKEEEKNIFDLILKSSGNSKLAVVKLVKEITGKGLKESKELVDNIPNVLKESVGKKEAEDLKRRLEEIGAEVELK
ncbi:MAG: 50S ribosomal protein L7/L12 [Flavobacteriales bacterium]|jgi:large subunit ribosomal protein L7/L12|uniref:50S ribosomal protein L7/L12 n=1 Tax=Blattabacterium sp. (Mastotermes darwiniensis) TaxID=39768 RepID=UPI000231DEAA|nr:50S ribosomal protein L7/L12 [Blattabacterium sp. (Mastotermes darwiniensis)]AER40734.1 50S ribosomal protein L7+L12 [Blattabacterium sp. (Mastotermes darwiniensis) str. MADAR]MDR1805117.1 50S ribosomal protein L7/L12 [Flavobacteriales bacterium]